MESNSEAILETGTEMNRRKSNFNSIWNNREFLKFIVSIFFLVASIIFLTNGFDILKPFLNEAAQKLIQGIVIATVTFSGLATLYNGSKAYTELMNNKSFEEADANQTSTTVINSLRSAHAELVGKLIDHYGADIEKYNIDAKREINDLIHQTIKGVKNNGIVPDLQKATSKIMKDVTNRIDTKIRNFEDAYQKGRKEITNLSKDLADISNQNDLKIQQALRARVLQKIAAILLVNATRNESNQYVARRPDQHNYKKGSSAMSQDDINNLAILHDKITREIKSPAP